MAKAVIDSIKDASKEHELKPEFIEKMEKWQKEPTVKVKDFKKHFGIE